MSTISMSTMSMSTRLLIAASIVLAAFFGLTGFTLNKVFRESAETAIRDRLEGHVYTLIAATIIGKDKGLQLPTHLSFSHPSSKLFAQAISNDAKKIWRSPSSIAKKYMFRWALQPVATKFENIKMQDGEELIVFSLGVSWDESEDLHDGYTFSVAEKKEVLDGQVRKFQKNLWGWLTGVALLLLTVQSFILRWGLSPLRRVVADLKSIEAGQRTQLQGAYPKELTGLTSNLNKLIKNEREHLTRYRDTLGNLAHSLKTPLAVLRGEVASSAVDKKAKQVMEEQVERMSQIVEYQLQRAATSGRSAITARVKTLAVVNKIVNALNKVYAEKLIEVEVTINDSSLFQGDEGDLLEILGNILDNAYKCCNKYIRISTTNSVDGNENTLFVLNVDDDGPGIDKEQMEQLIQRGVRGDSTLPGQGIGLAVVNDILQVYSGKLEIGKSDLGGARLTISVPVG